MNTPHTHDLGRLLLTLETMGASVEPFRDLASYSSFGVQFRYEAFDDPGEEPLDRAKMVQDVTELLRVVEALLQS